VNLVSFANSRLGPGAGMVLSGLLPRPLAYRLADWLTARVAARPHLETVRAIRANQAVVRGLPADSPALDGHVAEVLRNAGRGYTDLFRSLVRGTDSLLQACSLDPAFESNLRAGLATGRGVIAVGAHTSSFDLFLVSLLVRGYSALGIAHREIQGSYFVLNRMRRDHGLEAMPVSVQALRAAIRRLRGGGLVITGVDRPVPEGEELTFFGRPARLPIGHARLALLTDSLIIAGACRSDGPGRYRVVGSDLIDPRKVLKPGQGEKDIAQHVISLLEDYIRSRPEEWLMYFPVWSGPGEMAAASA
jgi:lauroyl/myristoyl acyltransferase